MRAIISGLNVLNILLLHIVRDHFCMCLANERVSHWLDAYSKWSLIAFDDKLKSIGLIGLNEIFWMFT